MENSTRRTSSTWTIEDNQVFENALAEYCPSSPDIFGILETLVGTKTQDQIVKHYNDLIIDLQMIEAGLIALPVYQDFEPEPAVANAQQPQPARKGAYWTPEEHKQFLKGFKKYGKGNWRHIAREYVKTRTSSQVASHGQKFILKLLGACHKNSKLPNKFSNSGQASGFLGAGDSNVQLASNSYMQGPNLMQASQHPTDFSTQENLEHSNLNVQSLSYNMTASNEASGFDMQISSSGNHEVSNFNIENKEAEFGNFGPSCPFFNQGEQN